MLVCTVAKAFYRSLLARGASPEPESRMYGRLPGRRREAAAIVQQAYSWRKNRHHQSHVERLHDATNAFYCIDRDVLCEEVGFLFREEDWHVMKFRVQLACFTVPG
eukprot:656669-Pyramimonas_sp.AAC.1